MTCRHCHVDSGPDRTDANMDRAMAEACVAAIDAIQAAPGGESLHTLDLTGGAPELNPHFEYLVDAARARGLHVIDRCNLTILTTNRYRHLPEWLAERGVEVACSLPHYRRLNTDAQRGDGTYEKSIEALRALNAAGYGQGDPDRVLTLVTNPVGAFLPGNQASLEDEWKAGLQRSHGVTFDRLIAITNIPMSRFLEWLLEKGQVEAYMERLRERLQPGDDRRADVPQHGLGRLRRAGVRLRLQPAAGDAGGRRAAQHRRLRPGRVAGAARPHGAALLRVHGRRGLVLRRRDGLVSDPRRPPSTPGNGDPAEVTTRGAAPAAAARRPRSSL